MKPLDIAAGLGVLLCWGLNFPIAKIGMAELPPLSMIGLRYALTVIVLAPVLRWPRGRFGLVALIAIALGGFHFPLMFGGIAGVDAAVSSIVMQAQAPFAVMLAILILGERMTLARLAGLALAFAGIALLAGAPTDKSSLIHIAMLVASAFAWAVASLLIKRLTDIGVFQLNAWVAVLAIPQVFVATAVFETGQLTAIAEAGWRGWGTVIFLALGGTLVGWGGMSYLLRHHPVSRVTPLTLAIPVIGVAAAVWILDEPLTWLRAIAGLLTLAGVAVVIFAPQPRAAQ